jgi:hypothetical protein
MNAYRPSEPRYTIVISKTAKSSARYEIAKQSRRAALSAGRRTIQNSGDNHRIEFYDGPDLIEAWSRTKATQRLPPNARGPLPCGCAAASVGRGIFHHARTQ